MSAEAMKAILTSGPLAIVLAAGLIVLWLKLRAKEIYYEGDPKEPEKTPGLLAKRAEECRDREDAIRKFYEGQLKTEREENKALYREIAEALKPLEED